MKIKVNSELSQTIQDIDFTGSTAANSELVKAILLLAHPVGSYYWSSDSTSPATLFGGTWTQIKDKFIIAVGDSHTAGTSYGSNTKDISHTHSYAHTHGIPGVSHDHNLSTGYAELYSGSSNIVLNQKTIEKTITFNQWTGGSWVTKDPYKGTTVLTLGGNSDKTTPSATITNSQSTSTSGSGGSTSLDITPSCIAAYCWRRTA